MKKIFSVFGMISLICLSFIISEKTAYVVKDIDEIMIEIKQNQEKYKQEPTNAKIINNTIIPGLNGKKIDIEKSYKEMKKIGTFNEKYIIYNEVKPTISSKREYEKYIISGNSKKNTVSLIFLVNENDKIDNIIKILNQKKIKATFFVDGYWLEENNELTLELIRNNHTVGNLGYKLNYQDAGFIWMNNILKKLGKQKTNYCYANDNIEDLKACSLQKNYTIKPNIIVKENPLTEIKAQIQAGSLIALPVNEKTNQELELIINYINSKGYNLENIQKHLSEKNN